MATAQAQAPVFGPVEATVSAASMIKAKRAPRKKASVAKKPAVSKAKPQQPTKPVWCWINVETIDSLRQAQFIGIAEAKFRLLKPDGSPARANGGGSFLNPAPAMLEKLEKFCEEQIAALAAQQGTAARVRFQKQIERCHKASIECKQAGHVGY